MAGLYKKEKLGKGSGIPQLERFRAGDRVRSAERSQGSVTGTCDAERAQRPSRHFGVLWTPQLNVFWVFFET